MNDGGFHVNLTVKTGENSADAFAFLKKLRESGYAASDSTIILGKACVPAGYCSDYKAFMSTYSAIVVGDQPAIFELVPEELNKFEATRFLAVCSKSMENLGRDGFHRDDIQNFLEYRASKKNSSR